MQKTHYCGSWLALLCAVRYNTCDRTPTGMPLWVCSNLKNFCVPWRSCRTESLWRPFFLPPSPVSNTTPSYEKKTVILSHPLRNFLWEEMNKEADFSGIYGDLYHLQSCLK